MTRPLFVAAVASAVVAGSATGVLAAPAGPPTAQVAVSESLTPVLYGGATATGSGAESIRFSARTVGAASWDLLNDVAVPGRTAYQQLPADRLDIGQAFEYQIAHCDSSGCAPSAVKTGFVSPALGAGARPGATRLPFTIGDRVGAQVDVGSGNLMVGVSALALPRRTGGSVDLGLAYNSVTRRSEAQFTGAVGSASSGWRLSTGPDVRLRKEGGYVVYHADNGLTGTFTPRAGYAGQYVPPVGFKMDLSGSATAGWTLVDHNSGEERRFDGAGRLTSIEDRSNNAVTFTYAASGALATVSSDVGPAGARTVNVTSTGTGAGRITELSQTVQLTDPATGYPTTTDSRSVSLSYDSGNRLVGMTDPVGRTTEFAYSAGGNLNRITAPGGAQTSFTYDAYGRVETVTQPTATSATGAKTRFLYGATTTDVADPNSDQSLAIDTAAHTRYRLTDDGRQLVASTRDQAGNERSKTYTPFLDVASATNTSGTTTFGYDDAVNGGESMTGATSATGAGSSYAYGNTAAAAQYQPSEGKDAQGNTSTYSYNETGQRVSTADFSSATASVEYNADGTVDTSTSPSGAVTDYSYNYQGQITGITPPAGSSLAARGYSWDGYGRLATRTSGRGITEIYSYDKLDRVLEVDYSDSTPTVVYTYDSAGRTDTRTDTSGLTSFDYDPLGRLTSRSYGVGGINGSVSYSYDKVGNLATAVNAAGTTTYSYDVRNLVTAMTPPDGRRIEFAHDADGRRTDTWFNVATGRTRWAAHSRTDYDASGRITRTWTSTASPTSGTANDNTRVSDLSYSYAAPASGACATAPPAGQDTSMRWTQTDNRTGRVTTYCYDPANRLVSASTPGGDSWAYDYDGNGNRTQTTKNGTVVQTLTVNTADQVTTTGYTFDASGNTTAAPGVAAAVAYNGAEQMTTRGDASYVYAGSDQTELVRQSGGGVRERSYTYGRTNSNGMPIIESYKDGTTTLSYLYDPQGTPLALLGGNSHYLAMDGLGSPTALINHDGGQTGKYSYDPYGGITATAVNGSGAIGIQIFGYAAGVVDNGSALVHFGMRWYDPSTGRFTQQDSLETLADPSRSNRYEYAAGNPVNFVDPSGLSPECTAQGLGGFVSGGLTGGAIGFLLGGPPGAIVGASVGSTGYSTYVEERCSGESVADSALSAGIAAAGGFLGGLGGNAILRGLGKLGG